MPSTGVSRIEGVDPSVAIKAPCLVATTTNITLSGAQTIDGVAVAETTPLTRVLVRAQTDSTENGIYDVSGSAWTRAEDFDGNRDVVKGTLVSVTDGTTYSGSTFKVTTANPVVINTSSIVFDAANAIDVITVVGTSGVDTYAKMRALTSGLFSPGDIIKCTGDGIFGDFKVKDATVTDNGGTLIVANDNPNRYYERQFSGAVYPKWFGAGGDGLTIDIAALNATFAYAKATKTPVLGGGPNCFYRIDSELIISHEVDWDGQMCQIYQETANTNCVTFDKGLSGAANYQNGLNVRRIVIAGAAGTGDGFTFVNTNESNFRDLYVVGVGRTAFANNGSLLSNFDHLYTGNGLSVSPGFFTTDYSPGNVNGIVHANVNGLGVNSCVYNRPSITNSTGIGYDISAGNGCVFISPDAEGISSPAVHMQLDRTVNIFGGNMEGSGGGIVVNSDNNVIQGVNNLSFIVLKSGAKGNYINGGVHKFPVVESGTINNTIQNITLSVGGAFSGQGAGTDNTIKNITNTSGNESGDYRSFTFTPILEFGGGSTGATWFHQVGTGFVNGDRVDFKVRLQINAKSTDTGSATINLNDIPFVSINDAVDTVVNVHYSGVSLASGEVLSTRLTENSKIITLLAITDTTGVNTALTDTNFSPNDQLWITGYYYR